MTGNPLIIDAGPALNFLAAGEQDLLCDVIDLRERTLLMPQTVHDEIHNKAERANGARFSACPGRLTSLLEAQRIQMLSDDPEDKNLVRQVERVAGIPMIRRVKEPKDLGETLVLAHALRMTADGQSVVVLIDESEGTKKARMYGLKVLTTVGVLVAAAGYGLVQDRGEMQSRYESIAQYDDGLPGWDRDANRNQLADKRIYLAHQQKYATKK